MRSIWWTSIAALGLAANAAVADDVAGDTETRDQPAELTPAAEALLDDFDSASRIRLSDDVPALAYSDAFATTLTRLDVRRSNAIQRLAKIRRLSLLTLAEVGQAQLFFGVSSDGTLGLHFGASSRKRTEDGLAATDAPYFRSPTGFVH